MRYLLDDLELDIKQTGAVGYNVFHKAVQNKSHGVQMAKLINEKDGDLKFQKDGNGDNALTLCAKLGDKKTMRYLLDDLKLDIKQPGPCGRNVFHRAVLNKTHGLQIAKLINEKDDELKFQKDFFNETTLTLCARFGDEKTMKYLLEDLKLDIKQTGDCGRNVFHNAVYNETHGIQIARLINKKDGELKFQKDRRGFTAVDICKQYGFYEKALRFLVDELKLEDKKFDKNLNLHTFK